MAGRDDAEGRLAAPGGKADAQRLPPRTALTRRATAGHRLRHRARSPALWLVDVDALLFLPLGLVGLNLYALLLVVLRGPLFGTRLYRPMVLNIGLSISPAVVMLAMLVVLVLVAQVAPSTVTVWVVLVAFGVLWLLLLPNAAYLVTELNLTHRKAGENVPLWYDIVLVLTLAMSGVLNTLANVAIAQLGYAAVTNPDAQAARQDPGSWVMAGGVLLLVAVGIYLGRYVRFNSWDLLHPSSFVRKLTGHFRVGANARSAVGFVLTHAVFLGILYLIVGVPAVLTVLPS